ncbi:MAG: dihydroorotase [Acidilobus sp.]
MEASICGRLYDAMGELGEGCLNVDGGLIRSITKDPEGETVYRFYGEGLVVVPGFIDLHVHLRGLELSYKEDEESGTKAAVSSGITLVLDMPNTRPRLSTPDAIMMKLKALSANSYVDYGVYAGVPDDPRSVPDLAKLPVAGFKVYPEDMGLRGAALQAVMKSGRLVVLHPELPEAERVADGENYWRGLARGCWLEGAAVNYLLGFGKPARLHVTHASCPGTLYLSKAFGATTDVTPHHILFDYERAGCTYRVNPPLRDPVTRSLLLKALVEGYVDALASDHAPHSSAEKSSWPHCPAGIPWLGLWPSLALELVSAGLLQLTRFLELTSLGPARILGIDSWYGLLRPGYRANVVILDLRYRGRFVGTYSKAAYYHAFMAEVYAQPKAVFVGGVLAAEEGEVLLKPQVVNPFSGGKLARPQG